MNTLFSTGSYRADLDQPPRRSVCRCIPTPEIRSLVMRNEPFFLELPEIMVVIVQNYSVSKSDVCTSSRTNGTWLVMITSRKILSRQFSLLELPLQLDYFFKAQKTAATPEVACAGAQKAHKGEAAGDEGRQAPSSRCRLIETETIPNPCSRALIIQRTCRRPDLYGSLTVLAWISQVRN